MKTIPFHFFISECDGSLYDTRKENWFKKSPLRRIYCRSYERLDSTNKLKATLRAGNRTDLGCYPLYFLTSDGCALSFETVRKHLRSVLWSIRNNMSDGWRVVGCEINYEDVDLFDEHTGEPIESAYGERKA